MSDATGKATRPPDEGRPAALSRLAGARWHSALAPRWLLLLVVASAFVVLASAMSIENRIAQLLCCCLGWCAIAIAWIDVREFRIPDVLSLPLIPIGLAAALIDTPTEPELIALSRVAIAGLVVAAAMALRRGYQLLRGFGGLGLGDVKLLAAGATWTGSQIGSVVLLASIAALVIALVASLRGKAVHAQTAVPFGAFLAPAIWIVWTMEMSLR